MTGEPPITLRPSLADVTRYRPGRTVDSAGGSVTAKLSSNEASAELDPSVALAAHDAATAARLYPDPAATLLRDDLAHRFGVDRDAVMVGCGSVGLIQQLLVAFASRGDVVVSPWISFEAYPILCRHADAEFVTTPLVDQTADVDAVIDAVERRDAKVVLLADPNNPTGTSVGAAAMGRLLDAVPAHTLVVLDQAYAEFVDPARVLQPPSEIVAQYPNVVVLRTFSKAYALAGLRVGYGIGHPSVIDAASSAALPFAVSSVAQAAARRALELDDIVSRRCADVAARRRAAETELRSVGWRDVPTGDANFVWVPTTRAKELGAALDAAGLVTRVFESVGVRITIGRPEDDRAVAECLKSVAASDGWRQR